MTPFRFFAFESNLESSNASESVLVLAPKQAHLETFGLLIPSGWWDILSRLEFGPGERASWVAAGGGGGLVPPGNRLSRGPTLGSDSRRGSLSSDTGLPAPFEVGA